MNSLIVNNCYKNVKVKSQTKQKEFQRFFLLILVESVPRFDSIHQYSSTTLRYGTLHTYLTCNFF